MQVHVWKNSRSFCFRFKKAYKDAKGKWKETQIYYPSEIACLNLLIIQAMTWVNEQHEYNMVPSVGLSDDAPEVKKGGLNKDILDDIYADLDDRLTSETDE